MEAVAADAFVVLAMTLTTVALAIGLYLQFRLAFWLAVVAALSVYVGLLALHALVRRSEKLERLTAEIERLETLEGAEINEAKKLLATAATAMIHGHDKAAAAAETARKTFEQGVTAGDLPTITIPRAELAAGLGVLAAFVKAGLVKSNGEARRQVQGGGLRVNDAAVSDEQMQLGPAHATSDGAVKLSLGRKKHVLLRPV